MTFFSYLRSREPWQLRYGLAFGLISLVSLAGFFWACTIKWQLAGLLLSIYLFSALQFGREAANLWYDYLEEKELARER